MSSPSPPLTPPPNPPYKDSSLPIPARISNLISHMTLAEKAGLLFHDMITMGSSPDRLADANPDFNLPGSASYLHDKHMNHFNLLGPITDARATAQWHNTLQRFVLQKTRLGIPVTLSTDPRNHFNDYPGTGFRSGIFSQWPETLGLAALRDPELVRRFADVARREYCAVGLRVALHPQVDLATEPRWARIGATFGEDAGLSARLVEAYIDGFQGGRGKQVGKSSVSTMTKHFPGGGPQKDGEDPHFVYGREQVYPGKNWEYHLQPFRRAVDCGGRQIMPYYGMPVGVDSWEEVGFAFNKSVITGLLREQLGFEGIVCTDWGLVTDAKILGQVMPARAWGCEQLSELERCKKIIEAGCDQFGGEARPELIVKLVADGEVQESRIDESVYRVLKEKFELGLFDEPFVDVDQAASIVGCPEFVAEGKQAQRRSYTLLKNNGNLLPLRKENQKWYTEGMDSLLAQARGLEIVDTVAEADVALLRLRTPYEPRPGGFEVFFHAGSLEYSESEKARQAAIYKAVPTVVDFYLDRPAAVPEIASASAAFLVNFGSSAEALLDVILGEAEPEGKLPFDLPSSMNAVEASRSDVPYDTIDPVFRCGDGLRYG